MSALGHLRKDGRQFRHGDLTSTLLISKDDLKKKFGENAFVFLEKFSTPATNSNEGFKDPFSLNLVMLAPLIDIGDHIYVPNQYRLFESIYESPFYWMMEDKSYLNEAAKHRGKFLEKTSAHIFRSTFGKRHVYENVEIRDGSKNILGEIDILVVYGEFVLVAQAKSKRITLKARSGDIEALKNDFEGAIQAPYRQSLECIKHIKGGASCITNEKKPIPIPTLPRCFPIVILSDPFPATTFLSGNLLERSGKQTPVIWDIGVLDCVAQILPSPIELIYYLQCRSMLFEKCFSDSEYNFLGYHLKAKLALADDVDGIYLDRDFATTIDDFMISADLGIKAKRPLGVLENLQIPVVSELINALKKAGPRLASIAVDLYDFSEVALENFSHEILKLQSEVRITGKEIKSLSIPTASGGITYAVVKKRNSNSMNAAEAIGAKHKYDNKKDRWYVILDCVNTTTHVDAVAPLIWPWKEDEEEAEKSALVEKIFHSRKGEKKS